MDIGKSFGYVFEDERWVTKVLIGGVLYLIPIANLAAAGYGVRTLQNVAAGDERPLPEWDDFGDYIVKGLLVAVAGFIYGIPLILLSSLSGIFGALAGSAGSSDAAIAILNLCVLGLSCVVTLYALLLGLWLPAATAGYATSGEFGAFFRFGEIWSFVSRNLGGYIVALLVAGLAALVAVVGLALCFVGVAFTTFWATLVYFHLLGQLARESGTALPREPAPAI